MHPCLVDTHSQITPEETGQIPTTLLEAMRFYRDPDVATRPLGSRHGMPALPFQGSPFLYFDPAHLEVPLVPEAILAQGRHDLRGLADQSGPLADCDLDGGKQRAARQHV